MLNEEVVLLDSDEEVPKAMETDTVPITNMNDKEDSLDKDNETGVDDAEDVVVEYNHNDYADLVGPLATNSESNSNGAESPSTPSVVTPMATPSPSISASPSPITVPKATTPTPVVATTTNTHPMRVPKRPGAMPPFALFSQEMRAKLQADDPDIGFGDLGRKLGEMWHALKEEEKEDYRKRAREVAEAKMKSWKETMSTMPPHKQLEMERQKRAPMKIKKKKTSGYAIFCSEYRRKYATEQPNMPFADISKQVAEDWRSCSEEARKGYEEKAQRFNTEEEKRWRQKVYAHQQNQMRMAAQNRQNSGFGGRGGQGWGQRQQGGYRPIQPNYGGRGRGGYGSNANHAQQTQYKQNNSNSSGLVISSVSSLSTSEASGFGTGLGLPQGISVHKAEPEINLPSSITISRVEPEILIVEENISRKAAVMGVQQTRGRGGVISPGRGRGGVVMNRGRAMSNMGMRSRGPGRPPMTSGRMMSPRGSMRGMPPVRGRPSLVPNGMGSRGGMMPRGRGMMSSSRGMGMQSSGRGMNMQNMGMTSPLKRMSPMGGHTSPRAPGMPPMKRARMPGPYNTMSMGVGHAGQSLNSAGAVNPATLDPVGRLCRVCGAPNAVIFRLKEKQELVGRIGRVLNLTIDLENDAAGGYPGVICRKCCNLVETFFHYKKSVAEGQVSLKKQVDEFKEKKAAIAEFKKKEAAEAAETARLQAEANEREQQLLVSRNSPESIGVDPLDSILPDQGSSILPDANQPDTKVGNIKIKQESLKTLMTPTASNMGPTTAAPMTAVFTDAVPDLKIKIEPGLVTVKKEKLEESELNEQTVAEKDKISVTEAIENDKHGELFSQLVGEVNKLNEMGEEKAKEVSSPTDGIHLSDASNITTDIDHTAVDVQNEGDANEDEDSMSLAITNVTTQLTEEESGVKSVTEVLNDISDTHESVTRETVSIVSDVKTKEVSESDTKNSVDESAKDLPNLPTGISITRSPVITLPEVSVDNPKIVEKDKSSTVTEKVAEEQSVHSKETKAENQNVSSKETNADEIIVPPKESNDKGESDDKLFSDIAIGEDPWTEAYDKSKDPDADFAIASGSWVPDDEGMEDLEAAPAMAIRDLRQRSDYFYDEDYGGGEGETNDLVPGADDPLLEMDDDDNTGDNDDFGGYDPLKLVQMTGGELNDLDFQMEDFDEDITMEDHDIMEDKDDHTEDGVDHEKDVDLTEEIREISNESKNVGKVSQVVDRENDLDISDESGLSDSRDGLNKDFDQGGDDVNEVNYNLDNDVDPPEKDSKKSDSKSKLSDKFSKSKNGGTVENTLDDSKEDDAVTLDTSISNEKVVGENDDFRDHIAGDENLNEDCDDDLKDDQGSDCNYRHPEEDHNFESVEYSKTDNFDGTSDDKDCINDDLGHRGDEKASSSLRKPVKDNHNVLSEDISTDNFENGTGTENVDDINDFSNTDEADFEFQIEQVQSIQDSSQAEDSTGTEPGSNCDNSA